MKKIYCPAILSCLLLLSSCSEEKTFSFTGREMHNVSFTVDNLSITGDEDMAESVAFDPNNSYYEEWTESVKKFSIRAYVLDNENTPEERSFENPYKNVVYAGGNNTLRFTFQPSCDEEKSARFTMPDGKVYDVDRGNPSFTWEINRGVVESIPDADYYRLIVTAESEYTKDGTICNNKGFIIINIDPMRDLCYNPGTLTWYYNQWLDGEPLFRRMRLLFDAINVEIGDDDSATSSKYEYGYYTEWTENAKKFILDIYDPSDTSDTIKPTQNEIRIDYTNVVWAGGNNDIRIRYTRNCQEQIEATTVFTMPDGKTFESTGNDTVFVWTLDSTSFANSFNSYNGYLIIEGLCKYNYYGIDTEANGYVLIDVDRNLRLRKDNNLWYRDYWAYTRSRSRSGEILLKK